MRVRFANFVVFGFAALFFAAAGIGAQPATMRPGDVDGDLDVDLADFASLAEQLCGPGYECADYSCSPADVRADYRVDLRDVAEFQNLYSRPSREGFVPGRIFVSDFASHHCSGLPDNGYPWDRIWEVDPETGKVTLFAELGCVWCGGVNGLAFTPDGSKLRVAQYFASRILELDANATVTVLYDSSDFEGWKGSCAPGKMGLRSSDGWSAPERPIDRVGGRPYRRMMTRQKPRRASTSWLHAGESIDRT